MRVPTAILIPFDPIPFGIWKLVRLALATLAAILLTASTGGAWADDEKRDSQLATSLLETMFVANGDGRFETRRIVRWNKQRILVWVMNFDATSESYVPSIQHYFGEAFGLADIKPTICNLHTAWRSGLQACIDLGSPDIFYVAAKSTDELELAWRFLVDRSDKIGIPREALLHYMQVTIRGYNSNQNCYASVRFSGELTENSLTLPSLSSAALANGAVSQDDAVGCIEVLARRALGLVGPPPASAGILARKAFFSKEAIRTLYSSELPLGATIEDVRHYLNNRFPP